MYLFIHSLKSNFKIQNLYIIYIIYLVYVPLYRTQEGRGIKRSSAIDIMYRDSC